jgi:hypothetical protein
MDFSFLISISDGDRSFIAEFVSTYEETTVALISDMIDAFNRKDFVRLAQIAHQVKPTGEMLGFDCQEDIVLLNKQPENATLEMLNGILAEAQSALAELKKEYSL